MVGELAAAYPENSSCASHLIDRVVFMRLRSIRIDGEVHLREATRLLCLTVMLASIWVARSAFPFLVPSEFCRYCNTRNMTGVFCADGFR